MNELKKIPEGWVETTLGEVVTFQRGFDLPTKDRIDGNFPLMVSNGQDGTHNEFKVKAPGIVTGRSGSLGNIFYVREDFWPLNTTLWIKEFNNNDVKFVYYFLKTFPFDKYNSGSGVPTLNRNHIHPTSIIFTKNINEQKSIAQILTAFDDKIELLQTQNKTLETLAQTIFTEWFGKYQNGDELPEGWRVGKLGDVLEIKYGKDHKHLEDGKIPLYGSGGIMRYVEKPLYEKPSILIPRKGTLSNLFYLNEPFWSVDTMFYTNIIKPFYGRFTFLFLKSLDLSAMNVGSAVPSLTTQVLNQIPIIIPVDKAVMEFDEIVCSFYKKIETNDIQIQTLTKTRDELLPRLMTGEIRVNEFKV